MAQTTENYDLYLEDDSSVKFIEWRKKINGTTDSNMIKIDNALASKQSKLSGTPGQVVGFDSDGNAIAQEAPDAENMVSAPGGATSDMPASLGAGPYTIEYTEDDPSEVSADQIGYDGTQSGIQAETVQGAIDALDSEVDQLGAEMELVSGENMFINSRWDSKDAIVNQRNQNEYTATGYTIDMWRMDAGTGAKLQIMDGFIRGTSLVQTETHHAIDQTFEVSASKNLAGKTVTLSCLHRGTGNFMLLFYDIGKGVAIKNLAFGPCENWTVDSLTFTLPTDLAQLRCCEYFDVSEGGTGYTDFKATKFELGSKQTLAHKEDGNWVLNDPPPNRALELLKCQGYQFGLAGIYSAYGDAQTQLFVHMPNHNLRRTPSISGISIGWYRTNGQQFYCENPSVVSASLNKNTLDIILNIPDGNFTLGQPIQIFFTNGFADSNL